ASTRSLVATTRGLRSASMISKHETVDRANLVPKFNPAPMAHLIRSDAEAVEIAHKLAADFAAEAAVRDEIGLTAAQVDRFSSSGLWGMSVPKDYGGAGVSFVTLGEVIKVISAADLSLGQF